MLAILLAELIVVAALSPELGEALVRLGYSEPCELRTLPAVRTLTALRRSSQWRRRSGVIIEDVPVDVWRELCWRYVVFCARAGDREAEVVFAVHMRPHRPAIHAAIVDATTGEALSWPTPTNRRGGPGWASLNRAKPVAPAPASARDHYLGPGLVASPVLAAATDPRGIPAIRDEPASRE